ncbi:hypothetical protein MNAB215_2405, partial [Mycobacterium numidiamassiliense]
VTSLFDWLTDPTIPALPRDRLPEYVFRYMGSDGLDATIRYRGLRMNVWSNMNDPREAKQWESTGSLTAIHPYTNAEMTQRLDDVLRRSAHLMSLSLDRDRSPDAEPDSLFHRGWAKAPMWANYANAHEGVCLVLDFPAVCEALEEHVGFKTSRYRNWGRINYADRPIRIDITGAFADQAALDEALYNFLETRYTMSGLHMTKNTEWDYERELRLAVVDRDLENHELDTPINLPLGNCIRAVIFGDAYPDPAGTARTITTALSPNAPEFLQCRWIVGAPGLERI